MMRLCWLVVLVSFLGCGGGIDTVPVEGVVRLDGQPLPEASVQFVPEGSGRDATATTDKEGRFELSTFEPRDGAVPGSYKVVIVPNMPIDESQQGMTADEAMALASAAAEKAASKPSKPLIPEQYSRADQTPLKQTVPAEGEIVIDLKGQ